MKANRSIGCTVTECKYHAKGEPMCSLDQIKVAKNVESTAVAESDTECASFEKEQLRGSFERPALPAFFMCTTVCARPGVVILYKKFEFKLYILYNSFVFYKKEVSE